MAIKLEGEGEGVRPIMAWPLVEDFFAASLTWGPISCVGFVGGCFYQVRQSYHKYGAEERRDF